VNPIETKLRNQNMTADNQQPTTTPREGWKQGAAHRAQPDGAESNLIKTNNTSAGTP
jgi:hypothetical protein